MTKEEWKSKFDMLYNYMAMSQETEYMMLFGHVMKQMMSWFIENKPEAAEKFVETLCAIKWRQYLTKDEATEIVKGMQPKAPWDYDTWYKAMDSLGLECEKDGEYNKYACWVAMNQVYTDFGTTIAKTMGKELSSIPAERIVPVVYDLAIDLLEDYDGKYQIRKYFMS